MQVRLLAAAVALCLAVVARGQCTPHFIDGYDYGRLLSTSNSTSDSISAAAVFDDHSGTGPALFIGGYLQVLGDQGGSWMAKLVGNQWVAIPGFDGAPRCMVVFDDGTGPALYVGGSFNAFPGGGAGCLARWNGVAWTGLGLVRASTSSSGVYALARYDDGHGMSLFAGGRSFGASGGLSQSFVMRYDGATWQSLGAGSWSGSSIHDPTAVRALAVFDNGDGPLLYAGGSFNTTPAGPSNCVVIWNGVAWSPAGNGLASAGVIKSLAVFQGALYAAGDAGVGGHGGVWRRNGALWELSYGSNADFPNTMGATALLSYDDGTGPALYAIVGQDAHTGSELAIYSNGAWMALGPPLISDNSFSIPFMATLVAAPTSTGTHLVAVGRCTRNGATPVPNVGAWVNGAWQAVEPVGRGVPGTVSRIYTDPEVDDGSIYIGVLRYAESGVTANGLPVGALKGMVRLHQGGTSSLVVTDGFSVRSNSGSGWQALPYPWETPIAMIAARDTGEETLVMASQNGHVDRLGTDWMSVGPAFGQNAIIFSLCSYDDGTGSRIFAGGWLGQVGSVTNCPLAYFDGSQWQPVPGVTGSVAAMTVFDFGAGPELVMACGSNSPASPSIMRWNGARIENISANLALSYRATAVLSFDDGTRRRLWIVCPSNPLGDLAYWDGAAWQPGGSGLTFDNNAIPAMASVRRSNGTRSLMVAGWFMHAGGLLASNLAEVAMCPRTCNADFNGDGDSGTDADIESFFACIAGTCCAQCGSGDFNNDGDSATDADIESFFRVLAGGGC